MAKLQLAAFSRTDIPEAARVPFYLYIDEFQNFASESFSVVLSEARKYGLSLIMAHQTPGANTQGATKRHPGQCRNSSVFPDEPRGR
jgi:hypothetical protein